MFNLKNKFALLIVATLVGCGGGSTPPHQPVALTAFVSNPDLLPDLTVKYNKICGSAANMQNAIPVDLNNDGRKDILLPLWCFIKAGQSQTGPVTNLLIALIQNADGTFSDKTEEVFGTEYPSLDGKNQNWAIADFNNVQVFLVDKEPADWVQAYPYQRWAYLDFIYSSRFSFYSMSV